MINSESDQAELERQRTLWRQSNLIALWESPTAHRGPHPPEVGSFWSWTVLRQLALDTIKIQSPAAIERRVLQLTNPQATSSEDESTVKNLAAAIQVLMPSESARPHRHSMNALRFMLEGNGVVTTVDGKACPMEFGDLILTPAWCWHEHHHSGEGPALWLDALDVPFHSYLGTAKFEPGPIKTPPTTIPDAAFSSPNLLPVVAGMARPYSPVFRYPYADACAAVSRTPPNQCGARIIRYVNPVNGGAPMASMDCRLLQIDAEVTTTPYRTNANAICLVVEGRGSSKVGNETFTWAPSDIFTIPQDNWVSHQSPSANSRLLVISDREILVRLGLFEESYGDILKD